MYEADFLDQWSVSMSYLSFRKGKRSVQISCRLHSSSSGHYRALLRRHQEAWSPERELEKFHQVLVRTKIDAMGGLLERTSDATADMTLEPCKWHLYSSPRKIFCFTRSVLNIFILNCSSTIISRKVLMWKGTQLIIQKPTHFTVCYTGEGLLRSLKRSLTEASPVQAGWTAKVHTVYKYQRASRVSQKRECPAFDILRFFLFPIHWA